MLNERQDEIPFQNRSTWCDIEGRFIPNETFCINCKIQTFYFYTCGNPECYNKWSSIRKIEKCSEIQDEPKTLCNITPSDAKKGADMCFLGMFKWSKM